MPLFAVVALSSFLAGAAFHWKWIGTASLRLLAWSSAAVAIVSESALLSFSVLTRDSQVTGWVMFGAWALLLGGPATAALIVFGLLSRPKT